MLRFLLPILPIAFVLVIVELASACSYDWEIGPGDPGEGGAPANTEKSGNCGSLCRCENSESCDFTCTNGPCKLECRNNARCSISCNSGTCTLDCKDNASCDMTCNSGTCAWDCAGNASCTGTCNSGFCTKKCEDGCDITCNTSVCQ